MHKAVRIDFAKFHQPIELHRAGPCMRLSLSEILYCVFGSYARA